MDFVSELKKKHMNIRSCSIKSGIPYATLYPIIKGKVDIGTCSYYTVEKLAAALGYEPSQIVYHHVDFQTFRNNLHHDIMRNELETVLNIIEKKEIEYYQFHGNYLNALYLLGVVDYISKKHEIPLCNQYNELRKMKLDTPYFVGDSALLGADPASVIEEFARFNIMEGDLYDAA